MTVDSIQNQLLEEGITVMDQDQLNTLIALPKYLDIHDIQATQLEHKLLIYQMKNSEPGFNEARHKNIRWWKLK